MLATGVGNAKLDMPQPRMQFKLPLADSIVYATMRKFDAVLWTRDGNFKNLPDERFFR
jgi:hypothetical protein